MSTADNFIPHYTVEDYQLWEGDWELWNGIPVAMTPSPFGAHAKLVAKAAAVFINAIEKSRCDATFLVEIDWQISNSTVLRPDALIVCGSEPERHVESTPALVIEVLSQSTRQRDLDHKKTIYQQQSVPYYLIIDPDQEKLIALSLDESGQYAELAISETLQLTICNDCQLEIRPQNLFD